MATKLMLLYENLNVIKKLIKRNMTNEVVKIDRLSIGAEAISFQNYLPREAKWKSIKKEPKSTSKSRNDPTSFLHVTSIENDVQNQKIKLPIFFYKIKSLAFTLSNEVTFDGKHVLTIQSECPSEPLDYELYEDFQIIKKLL